MNYESVAVVESRAVPGVNYTVALMSFGRRVELMRRVRELAGRVEFLEAGADAGAKMDAGMLRAEIDRLYLIWGLRSVAGLQVDGVEATVEMLADCGPEELFREALAAVRAHTGMDDAERKN